MDARSRPLRRVSRVSRERERSLSLSRARRAKRERAMAAVAVYNEVGEKKLDDDERGIDEGERERRAA